MTDLSQISKSPINTSTSKHMFSFGGAQRFPISKKSYCERSAYDLPSGKKQRAAGFGVGRRMSFAEGKGIKRINKPWYSDWRLRFKPCPRYLWHNIKIRLKATILANFWFEPTWGLCFTSVTWYIKVPRARSIWLHQVLCWIIEKTCFHYEIEN